MQFVWASGFLHIQNKNRPGSSDLKLVTQQKFQTKINVIYQHTEMQDDSQKLFS